MDRQVAEGGKPYVKPGHNPTGIEYMAPRPARRKKCAKNDYFQWFIKYGRALFYDKFGKAYEGDTRTDHAKWITEMWNEARDAPGGWDAAGQRAFLKKGLKRGARGDYGRKNDDSYDDLPFLEPFDDLHLTVQPAPLVKKRRKFMRQTENEMEIRQKKAFPYFTSRLRITMNNQPRNGRTEDDVLRELRCFVLVVHEYTSNSQGDKVVPAEVTLLSYSLAQGMQKALSQIIEYKHSILNPKDDRLDEVEYSNLLISFEKNGITSGTQHLDAKDRRHPPGAPELIPLDRLKSHLIGILMETNNKNAPILFLSENYNQAAGMLYTLFADNWEHLEARFCFLDDMAQVYSRVQNYAKDTHPVRDYRDLPVPSQCPYHVAVAKARKGKANCNVDCTLQKAVKELQYLFKQLADSRVLNMDQLYDRAKHTQCDEDTWDTDGPQIDWGEVEQEGRRIGAAPGNYGGGGGSGAARRPAAADDSDSDDDSDDGLELPTMRAADEGPQHRNSDAGSVGWGGSQHSSGGGGGRGGYAGSQASSGAGGYGDNRYGNGRGGGSDYGRDSAKENNWGGRQGGDSYGNSMRNGAGGSGQNRQYEGGDGYSSSSRYNGGSGYGRNAGDDGWRKSRDPSPGFAYDNGAPPRASYNNYSNNGGLPSGYDEDARPAQRRRAPSPTPSDRSRGGGGGYNGDRNSDRGAGGGIRGKMWAEDEQRARGGGRGLDEWKEQEMRGGSNGGGNAGSFSRPSFPREGASRPTGGGVFGPRPAIAPAPVRQPERSADFEAGRPQRTVYNSLVELSTDVVPTAPVLQHRGTEMDVDEAYRKRDEQRTRRNEAQQREREQREREAREGRYGGGRQTSRDAHSPPRGDGDKRREDRLNPVFGAGPSRSGSSLGPSSNFYSRGVAPTLTVPEYGRNTREELSPKALEEKEEDEWVKSTVKFLPRGTFDKEMDRIRKEMKQGPRVAPTFRPELYSASTESRGDPLHPREEANLESQVNKLSK